jgi:hypothetical protein
VQQRRQSHGAKLLETNSPEMALFVPAKNCAKHLLGQPAVQKSQLILIVYVFQVIVEDGDVAYAFFNGFGSDVDQRPSAGQGIGFPLPAPAASKRKTKLILNFA